MKLAEQQIHETYDENQLYERLLPLDGSRIVELGCGAGAHTRAIANAGHGRSIDAYEVDEIQHRHNAQSCDVSNIEFKYGAAQAIPEPDATFDVALMFKSLHHVPVEDMQSALHEIHRVLKPGGYLYVSEPIFAGAFNDIIKRFHDEKAVREAAFSALSRAVDDGLFELADEIFFKTPVSFASFADFEDKIIGATHSEHQLDAETYAMVKLEFEQYLGDDGAQFEAPMRVDLLRKPIE